VRKQNCGISCKISGGLFFCKKPPSGPPTKNSNYIDFTLCRRGAPPLTTGQQSPIGVLEPNIGGVYFAQRPFGHRVNHFLDVPRFGGPVDRLRSPQELITILAASSKKADLDILRFFAYSSISSRSFSGRVILTLLILASGTVTRNGTAPALA
jgi:hypothetical protein